MLAVSSDAVRVLRDPAAISILAQRTFREDREALAKAVISDGIQEPYVADIVLPVAGQLFVEGRLTADEMVSWAAIRVCAL